MVCISVSSSGRLTALGMNRWAAAHAFIFLRNPLSFVDFEFGLNVTFGASFPTLHWREYGSNAVNRFDHCGSESLYGRDDGSEPGRPRGGTISSGAGLPGATNNGSQRE